MRFVSLLAVLALALPAHAVLPLEEAKALVAKKSVDEVYVAYSALKKGQHPAGDAAVAKVLVDAAKVALDAKDATLSLGLSDKARKLDPASVDACLVNADALVALDQRGAAEEALEAAVKLAPKDWAVVFRRADYAEQEGQLDRAYALFRSIPPAHAKGAEAKERAAKLSETIEEQGVVKAAIAREERERLERAPSGASSAAEPPPPPSGGGAVVARGGDDGDVPAGMAARESDHFRIVYFSSGRDFAQRAQYEQKVLDMFERAYVGVRGTLSRTTNRKVDVVLYTADEFRFHFGAMFGGGVLGFYSGKIRMNYAEQLDDGFYATAVHEYVHAVVDDVAGGKGGAVPLWFNEGLARWVERRVAGGDWISFQEKSEMKRRAEAGTLATFQALEQRTGDTWLPYAKGATAIEVLSKGGGLHRIMRAIEGVRGGSFASAFAGQFGAGRLEKLDAEVDAFLTR